MPYLIDTNIIIYSLKGSESIGRKMLEYESIPKAISVITYGELLYGAKKSQHPEKNLAIVYRIKELFEVLKIDKPIIETFSEIKAALVKQGKPADDMDLLIGATALTRNLTLITHNTKHFKYIDGLNMEDWNTGKQI